MALFAFVFGLLWGSFCNVLIDRLPKGKDVVAGRSKCDFCKKTLRWFELIPVLSFAFQGCRCLRCKKKLSFQYPFIELVTAISFACIYQVFFPSVFLMIAVVMIFSACLVIFMADVKFQIIPDSMIVFLALGTLFWRYLTTPMASVVPYIVSSLGCGLFFYALWLITRRRGIGFGDVKLSFVMGFLLGFPEILIALYIAFLTGACIGVILIIARNKTLKSKIAFGPFLLFGMGVALVFHTIALQVWHIVF